MPKIVGQLNEDEPLENIDPTKFYVHPELGKFRIIQAIEEAGRVEIKAVNMKGRIVTIRSIDGIAEYKDTPAPTRASNKALDTVFVDKATLDNLLVVARAGCGKTTTIMEFLQRLRHKTPTLVGSVEQESIWKHMLTSDHNSSVVLTSFANSIVKELQHRVEDSGFDKVTCKTMHSIGFGQLIQRFGKLEVDGNRHMELAIKLSGNANKGRVPAYIYDQLMAVAELVDYCKMTLTEPTDLQGLEHLSTRHNLGWTCDFTELVAQVYNASVDFRADGKVSFSDMIWGPLALDLILPKFDIGIGDEAQDFNKAQQKLFLKMCDRAWVTGDDMQAIYGFGGADTESLAWFTQAFSEMGGHAILPLKQTRRCGHAIVKEAQTVVPDIQAHPDNGAGTIIRRDMDFYRKSVQPNQMVLCRNNAPLVRECLNRLAGGHKAFMQGRDVGASLIKLVQKLAPKGGGLFSLQRALDQWAGRLIEMERTKKYPSEITIQRIESQVQCIGALCTHPDVSDVASLVNFLENLFTDGYQKDATMYSSIHKAKGLESQTVWFLQPQDGKCPSPMAVQAWEHEQELHLWYVAVTRAICSLCHISE